VTAPDLSNLAAVVEAVLSAEPPKPQDVAVSALALTYAREIDAGGDLTKLGPSLLGALEALHLSPRARAAAQKGMKQSAKPGASPLDELRNRRARKHGAAAGDATTP
jgi:hypothetical protein